jgi:hypothetical protein
MLDCALCANVTAAAVDDIYDKHCAESGASGLCLCRRERALSTIAELKATCIALYWQASNITLFVLIVAAYWCHLPSRGALSFIQIAERSQLRQRS